MLLYVFDRDENQITESFLWTLKLNQISLCNYNSRVNEKRHVKYFFFRHWLSLHFKIRKNIYSHMKLTSEEILICSDK